MLYHPAPSQTGDWEYTSLQPRDSKATRPTGSSGTSLTTHSEPINMVATTTISGPESDGSVDDKANIFWETGMLATMAALLSVNYFC